MNEDRDTKFASPERSDARTINVSKQSLDNNKVFVETLNSFPDVVLVLDKNRQIVTFNQQLLNLLGISYVEEALGKRPGEVFKCIHSERERYGCGTSDFCQECSAVQSILEAQHGVMNSSECRMTIRGEEGGEALDLRVWSVPYDYEGQQYTIFTVRDIADEKRRESLERTFFHDILNDVELLSAYSENVRDGMVNENENPVENMVKYSKRLTNTINAQRDLLAAERGEFEPAKDTINVIVFLKDIIDFFRSSPLTDNREIVCNCQEMAPDIQTDRQILWRILNNLIKNALEATESDGIVTVGYVLNEDGKHCFSVHNQKVMSESVRRQIFQRSFSTKGRGRGIGTYSVKLFAERYLNGKVDFSSKEGEGTIFSLILR